MTPPAGRYPSSAAGPSPIPAVAALAILALELKHLARLHTPAMLLHYAVAALLPPPSRLRLPRRWSRFYT
jgi:hypothetical protein